jgi:hypothetical protein
VYRRPCAQVTVRRCVNIEIHVLRVYTLHRVHQKNKLQLVYYNKCRWRHDNRFCFVREPERRYKYGCACTAIDFPKRHRTIARGRGFSFFFSTLFERGALNFIKFLRVPSAMTKFLRPHFLVYCFFFNDRDMPYAIWTSLMDNSAQCSSRQPWAIVISTFMCRTGCEDKFYQP